MAIAKKPTSNQQALENFIRGGAPAVSPTAAPTEEKEGRKAVILRLPPELVDAIDKAAKRRGVSRSAWMAFALSHALDAEKD